MPRTGHNRPWSPDKPLPDPRAEKFAVIYATEFPGLKVYEVAQKAGYARTNKYSASVAGSRKLNDDRVWQRIQYLAKQAAEQKVMSRSERMERLSLIGRGLVPARKKGLERGEETDLTETGPEIQLRAIQELNEIEGVYAPRKVTADLPTLLAGVGGIRFVVNLEGKLPPRTIEGQVVEKKPEQAGLVVKASIPMPKGAK